jgi:hypothetical protein
MRDDGVRLWTGHEWGSREQTAKLRDLWKRLLAEYGVDVPQLLAAARIMDDLFDLLGVP